MVPLASPATTYPRNRVMSAAPLLGRRLEATGEDLPLQVVDECRAGELRPRLAQGGHDGLGPDVGGLLVEVVEGVRVVVLGDGPVLLDAGLVRLVEVERRE